MASLAKAWWDEGRKAGLEEVRRERWEENVQKGKLKAKQEVAINLLKEGCDLDMIVRITGLSIEDIGKLRLKPKRSVRKSNPSLITTWSFFSMS